MTAETVPFDVAPERVMVSDRWPLMMAPHRAARPEWTNPPHYWEGPRLARMHEAITDMAAMARDTSAGFDYGTPVVWDVGAEEGDMPALYATWGADVVLIEPNPKVWPCIRYHWLANNLPDPLGMYVGLVGASPNDEHEPPMSGVWPECAVSDVMWPAHGFHHLDDYSTTDPVATLDLLLERFPEPDIITADIEGGEGHMLKGAERMLSEVRPVWFLSVHSHELRELYGHNPSEHVHDVMAAHGYTAELIEDRHEAHWVYYP